MFKGLTCQGSGSQANFLQGEASSPGKSIGTWIEGLETLHCVGQGAAKRQTILAQFELVRSLGKTNSVEEQKYHR